MLTASRIMKTYSTCLDWALLWLQKRAYIVNTRVRIVTNLSPSGREVYVRMSEALHCKDWPYRPGSREKVDILVHTQEIVSLSEEACIKSSIRVNYFRIEDKNTAKATESLRYDCVVPPDVQHPICHVQGDNDILEIEMRPESFSRSRTDVVADGIAERHKALRIPSAFVNLPGILAILAADHMSEVDWRDFMPELLKRCEDFPQVRHSAVTIVASGQLCAWAWYDLGVT